jgi:hypothetical protein
MKKSDVSSEDVYDAAKTIVEGGGRLRIGMKIGTSYDSENACAPALDSS